MQFALQHKFLPINNQIHFDSSSSSNLLEYNAPYERWMWLTPSPSHIMNNKYNIHAKWLDVQLTSSI